MDQFNDAPELKRKVEVQLADVDKPFDYNKDNTPVKESDHIIQDDKIEIDFSDRNQPPSIEQPTPRMQANSPCQTFENLPNLATDRKFTESDTARGSPQRRLDNIEVILMDDQLPPKATEKQSLEANQKRKASKVIMYFASLMSFFIFSLDILYVL